MSVIVKSEYLHKSDNCAGCPLFKSNSNGYLFCRGKGIAFGKEDGEWIPKTTPNWCPIVDIIDEDLRSAIELLIFNYEKSISNNYVKKPLAHALYHTWKSIDICEDERTHLE